jgi:hypothetical protein
MVCSLYQRSISYATKLFLYQDKKLFSPSFNLAQTSKKDYKTLTSG